MNSITQLDLSLLEALQRLHCKALNVFFGAFTYMGEAGALWIIAGIVMLFFAKRRRAGWTVLTALLLELLLNEHLVKKLIRRPRPFTLQPALDTVIPHPGSFSFPSGHTASSFAAATAIFMYDKKLGTAAYIVAALIGFSRNYFGVHYPTDVLAGALFGVLIGLLAFAIVKGVSRLFSRR